jgi:hypothetical protein
MYHINISSEHCDMRTSISWLFHENNFTMSTVPHKHNNQTKLIQFTLPDVLCRLNQSHVCARIWQQLLHQTWMTHLCHFHPNPLCPVKQKKMAFLHKFSHNHHNSTILTARLNNGVEMTYSLLHFLLQMTCRPLSWSMTTILQNILYIYTPPQALDMSCKGCIKLLVALRSIVTLTKSGKARWQYFHLRYLVRIWP